MDDDDDDDLSIVLQSANLPPVCSDLHEQERLQGLIQVLCSCACVRPSTQPLDIVSSCPVYRYYECVLTLDAVAR